MAFILKDNQQQAYDELWDVVPGAIVVKGFAQVVNDVFGFFLKASTSITEEVCFIYHASQVEADKLTGTGESISAGEKVYATLGSSFQSVTANPTGTIGTDYYYCGIAKKDAAATDTTVLIKFIGQSYNHADEV